MEGVIPRKENMIRTDDDIASNTDDRLHSVREIPHYQFSILLIGGSVACTHVHGERSIKYQVGLPGNH
ncbi:MAG: hypothetical protein LBV45_03250 [Xanthomonadaceae bacterium]|jgi:hypothetical protein|nr:hypothetical protein [Xanthomonadaceae bacterium]